MKLNIMLLYLIKLMYLILCVYYVNLYILCKSHFNHLLNYLVATLFDK